MTPTSHQATPAKQTGAIWVEFVVVASFLLIALISLVPMLTQYIVLKHQAQQAERFRVWEQDQMQARTLSLEEYLPAMYESDSPIEYDWDKVPSIIEQYPDSQADFEFAEFTVAPPSSEAAAPQTESRNTPGQTGYPKEISQFETSHDPFDIDQAWP